MATQIRNFSLSRLTVGAASYFHHAVLEMIEASTPAALHVEGQFAAYKALCDQFDLIVNRKKAFVATPKMIRAANVRNRYVGMIRNVTRANLSNPIEEKRKAAERLWAVLSPFKGIGHHEYTKRNAEIARMVVVLNEPAALADVQTLGLAAELEGLAAADLQCDATFDVKLKEVSARLPQRDINTPKLLREAALMYRVIVQRVNAFAIAQHTDTIQGFIDKLNGLVGSSEAIIEHDTTRKSPKKEEVKADKQTL